MGFLAQPLRVLIFPQKQVYSPGVIFERNNFNTHTSWNVSYDDHYTREIKSGDTMVQVGFG